MSPQKATRKSDKSTTATNKKRSVLTDEERAAMKELVKERKSAASKEEDASALLAKIAEMADSDRAMAKRVHAIVKASAPFLSPKLWYGMPAYYKDGKVVCFFQDAQKFKSRYATFGFSGFQDRRIRPLCHPSDAVMMGPSLRGDRSRAER